LKPVLDTRSHGLFLE